MIAATMIALAVIGLWTWSSVHVRRLVVPRGAVAIMQDGDSWRVIDLRARTAHPWPREAPTPGDEAFRIAPDGHSVIGRRANQLVQYDMRTRAVDRLGPADGADWWVLLTARHQAGGAALVNTMQDGLAVRDPKGGIKPVLRDLAGFAISDDNEGAVVVRSTGELLKVSLPSGQTTDLGHAVEVLQATPEIAVAGADVAITENSAVRWLGHGPPRLRQLRSQPFKVFWLRPPYLAYTCMGFGRSHLIMVDLLTGHEQTLWSFGGPPFKPIAVGLMDDAAIRDLKGGPP